MPHDEQLGGGLWSCADVPEQNGTLVRDDHSGTARLRHQRRSAAAKTYSIISYKMMLCAIF